MRVRDVMHVGVATADADMPLADVARLMRDQDVGAAPVLSGGRLVGMITDRDIVCRGLAGTGDPRSTTASQVMSAGAVTCAADDDLDDAMETMSRREIRRLPVVDGTHQLVGMLSLGDVASRVDDDDAGEVLRAVSAHHA